MTKRAMSKAAMAAWMLPTTLKARLLRAVVVVGGMVVSALLGVVASDDFRAAVGDAVGDATLTTVIVMALGAALTQVAGHLIGKRRRVAGEGGDSG